MNQAGDNTGSQTTTAAAAPAVLRLRPTEQATKEKTKKKSRSRVRWTEDVVDNEHMNKKKSKICCIFHPQREFGESSGESSGSSSDSSDSSGDEKNEGSSHEHEAGCKHHRIKKKPSPNAYERQPHYKNQSEVPTNAI